MLHRLATLAVVVAASTGCLALRSRADGRRLTELIAVAKADGIELPDPLVISPAVAERVLQQVGREGTELDRIKRLQLKGSRDEDGSALKAYG